MIIFEKSFLIGWSKNIKRKSRGKFSSSISKPKSKRLNLRRPQTGIIIKKRHMFNTNHKWNLLWRHKATHIVSHFHIWSRFEHLTMQLRKEKCFVFENERKEVFARLLYKWALLTDDRPTKLLSCVWKLCQFEYNDDEYLKLICHGLRVDRTETSTK